jgi:hypothetical protein
MRGIYELPIAGRYVFAACDEQGWMLHGDALRQQPSYLVMADGWAVSAFASDGPVEGFHIQELQEWWGARAITTHAACGEFSFPSHDEVCLGEP